MGPIRNPLFAAGYAACFNRCPSGLRGLPLQFPEPFLLLLEFLLILPAPAFIAVHRILLPLCRPRCLGVGFPRQSISNPPFELG
ncbi:hypothetical protein C8P63_14014 [Melghirimyces profundicolus]|uniref:Uncharacterized protein n=1 Tax=Melghirimyces profundicolus TaxID=1242148 RepID=A0A2T6B0J5_9BACL|nr:hypothetical protein C8P63_14014 [Melghirimyces profundicolus]